MEIHHLELGASDLPKRPPSMAGDHRSRAAVRTRRDTPGRPERPRLTHGEPPGTSSGSTNALPEPSKRARWTGWPVTDIEPVTSSYSVLPRQAGGQCPRRVHLPKPWRGLGRGPSSQPLSATSTASWIVPAERRSIAIKVAGKARTKSRPHKQTDHSPASIPLPNLTMTGGRPIDHPSRCVFGLTTHHIPPALPISLPGSARPLTNRVLLSVA